MRKKYTSIFALLGVIAVLALVVVIVNQQKQKTLPTYQGNQDIIVEHPTEAPPDIRSVTYASEDGDYSMLIPEDWTEVHRNGKVEFIHAASSTSVSITEKEYAASVNNLDESTISSDITGQGYSFISFSKPTPISYELLYQKIDTKVYDYITEAFWSRDKIVELTFTMLEENFEKMKPYVQSIYSSFAWANKVDKVPEGYQLIYIDYGNFEFGMPTTWTVGVDGSVITAYNTQNTVKMSITLMDYTGNLSEMTSFDFASMVQQGRENGFILNNFTHTATSAVGDSQYFGTDGVNTYNKTFLWTNSVYLYSLQFDFVENGISTEGINICSSLFREFITKELEEYRQTHPEQTEMPITEAISESTTEKVAEQ